MEGCLTPEVDCLSHFRESAPLNDEGLLSLLTLDPAARVNCLLLVSNPFIFILFSTDVEEDLDTLGLSQKDLK